MLNNSIHKLSIIIVFFLLLSKFWTYYLYYRFSHQIKHNVLSNTISKYPSGLNIRVLSYNLFLLPNPFFCNLLDHSHSDFKNERCNLISQITKKYDIILFQEIHPSMNYRCNILIENAKKNGLPYYYYSLGPSLISRYCLSNGLLILSRYPIVDTSHISFNQSSSYDNFIEKGCIYAKIKINNVLPCIHVYNTHLQASYDKTPKWEKIRLSQLQQLNKFIKTKSNIQQDNIIFGGDFNIDSASSEGHFLNKTMKPLKDSFIKKKLNHTITIPFNSNYIEDTRCCLICKKCKVPKNYILEKQRLDYIFYNGNHLNLQDYQILPYYTKKQDMNYKQLSDHNAIFCEFKFKN